MKNRILVFFAVFVVFSRSAFAFEVTLFTDTAYVDYFPGETGAEASNIEWELDFRGDTAVLVDSIADISSVGLTRDTFVIPELERGDLAAALTAGQRADLANFVNNGGRLISFLDGNSIALLNSVFGFSLVSQSPLGDLSLNVPGAMDTPYGSFFSSSVPLHTSTSGVSIGSLPPGGRAIYTFGESAGVIAIARGKGWIIGLGWDWFNPSPVGDLNGWRSVLRNALDFGARWSTRASATPNLAIPDGTAETVSSTISNFPATFSPLSELTRFQVTVAIDHTWSGDLVVSLENDSGASYLLMDRRGGGIDLQSGFPLTFSNHASTSMDAATSACLSPVFDDSCTRWVLPENPLPVGDTALFSDTWRLTLADFESPDPGTLVRWEISALPEFPAAGVSFDPPSWQDLLTSEDGRSDGFTLVLNSKPSADVTIDISSSNVGEGSVYPTSVTFTPDNWDTPQRITVTGVDDTAMDGNQDYTVITAPAVSADSNYNGVDADDVDARNIDDEIDIYEGSNRDDTVDDARVILPTFGGFTQAHTLDNPDDVDWVKFYRDDYVSDYYFRIENFSASVSLVLEVLDTDGVTVLCSAIVAPGANDEITGGFCANFNQVAIYYARVRAAAPFSGEVPQYEITFSVEGAFESRVYGSVTDSVSGQPIEAAVMRAVASSGSGGSYKLSNQEGNYSIDLFLFANPLDLVIQKDGYVSQTIPFTAPDFSALNLDVQMVPMSDQPDVYEDDDSAALARVIQPRQFVYVQSHTLHDSDDRDWLKFYKGQTGGFYELGIEHKGGAGNLVLELYDTDQTTLLCGITVAPNTVGNMLVSNSTVCPGFSGTAIYYVQIRPESGFSGTGPNYDVWGRVTGAYDFNVSGFIRDQLDGSPLEGAVLHATLQSTGISSAYKLSDPEGGFSMEFYRDRGDYVLSIQKAGYVEKQIPVAVPDPVGNVDLGEILLQPIQTGSDDVVVDFGGLGLWARMNHASWLKLHNGTPDRMVVADMDGNGQADVIADYGSSLGGIYVKRNLGGWSKLHNSSAQSLAVGDLDNNGKDDVVIDFGVIGLWARMDNTSWLKLADASPEAVAVGDMDGNGDDDVIADFSTTLGGLFVKRNLGGWTKLHNSGAQALTTGDLDNNGKDDVVVDFGAIGFWARMNDASWLKLHNSSPERVAAGDVDGNGAGDVLATFSGLPGLWLKQNLGGWVRISIGTPEQFATADVNGDGAPDVVGDFGVGGAAGGLFVRRNGSGWSKLHNSSPEDLVTGDLD